MNMPSWKDDGNLEIVASWRTRPSFSFLLMVHYQAKYFLSCKFPVMSVGMGKCGFTVNGIKHPFSFCADAQTLPQHFRDRRFVQIKERCILVLIRRKVHPKLWPKRCSAFWAHRWCWKAHETPKSILLTLNIHFVFLWTVMLFWGFVDRYKIYELHNLSNKCFAWHFTKMSHRATMWKEESIEQC